MWSNDKDNQSRQTAQGLINSVKDLAVVITRLQVQQQMLEERLGDLRDSISQLKEEAKGSSLDKRDIEELRNRILMLETVLTTLMKDMDDEFVSEEDFEKYKQKLHDEADRRRVEIAEEEVKRVKSSRQQIGLVIGGVTLALSPKIVDLLRWIIEHIIPPISGG